MDAKPEQPLALPNYLTDGMLPHEYEPMRAARHFVHSALASYIAQLAGYYDRQDLALTATHIRREILDQFQSMDYDAALSGLDLFRKRYDQFEVYVDTLDRLEELIDTMRRHDMPYWFPYGIDA